VPRLSLAGRGGFVFWLSGATTSGCQLPHMIEEDGALQGVELGGVGRDLGEERVGHENGRLVAMAGVGVAEQGRDVDLQRFGEAIQRGESRHGLTVLDLGDVSPGNIHACSELPLGQVADVPEIANRGCDLKAAFLLGLGRNQSDGCGDGLRYLDLEGFAAATAERAGGAKLHQTAIVTTQNLTLFDGRHHGCHKLSVTEGPRARTQHTSDNGTM
jgi:hypothetical protein